MTRGSGGVAGAQMINTTAGAAFSGTVLAFITGDGGTQTAATNSCVAEGNGFFSLVLTGPETDFAVIAVTFIGTGAIPVTTQYLTTAAVPTPAPSTAITGPGVTTALTLITDAFEELNVFMPGEAIPATDGQKGLRVLNAMIGQWAQERLTIPAVIRETFDIVANQASYTIGPGGDFDTVRPQSQDAITGASLVITTSDPPIELPLPVMGDTAWRLLTPKGTTGAQPTLLYYNPTFTALYGTISLWPIPNTAVNDLALYTQRALTTFADLTTTYAFPDGYQEALTLNLARRLATPYGKVVSGELLALAMDALATIKRSNTKLLPMANSLFRTAFYDFNSGVTFVR